MISSRSITALDRSQVMDLEEETDAKAQEVRDKYPVAILDFHYEPIQDVFLVSRIVVPHDKRGQGIGTAVMQELVDYAKSKGKRVALTPVPEHPLNETDIQRLDRFYKNVGFKRNRNKSINEDMIACREIPKFAAQAPQTYNDMGTTTKNVRQWTVEDPPLASEGDKIIPVKKINTDVKDFKE
jgi:GNAT superfamily N-acetyltransferase